ncbi:response regulator [Roseateles asaccharophilus]|uniref:CheY-like chemotaxis protein/Flp pilus assembly protein TadD n=1 Tax=Roseateles asaccharophilus TaxID=582607 RepID=A0ABU2A2D5_9BURK|nr:response regulator [Roseateles asaccharophilus]MDR7331354.1 CheY-like chemotaxis protein/Flp pilus assembly protein TadD [Roseateles asaccharophilus]
MDADPLRTRSFLLVEDFEAMRSVLKGLLLRCGAQRVDTASDGHEASRMLNAKSYDVVMCDYDLGPGKNGQQLLEEARLKGWIGPASVWLMITAEKTSIMVSAAAEDAPDDYLLKPITEGLLQTRLLKLVERKASMAGIAAAMKAHDWRRALQLCSEQLSAGNRNVAEILRLQALLHQKLDEWPKAQAVYESVLKRGPLAWAKLGLAQVRLHAGDQPAALALLQDIVRDHPQYLDAYDELADLLADQGQAEQQLALLDRAVKLSPNSAQRQAALGKVALAQGQRDMAERAFTRSIKLTEHSAIQNVEPFLGMSRLHCEAGAPDEARKMMASLTQRYDGRDVQLLARAEEVRALQAAGDADGATRLATELAAMSADANSPASAQTALRIAETLMETGQADGATQLLQYVTRNNYDDEALLRRTQRAFDNLGMGAAGGELVAAAKRQATDAMKDGVRLLSQGDLAGALASLRGAKTAMPRNGRVLLNFAAVALTCMDRQGRTSELEAEVRASIATARLLRPDDTRADDLLKQLAKLAGGA